MCSLKTLGATHFTVCLSAAGMRIILDVAEGDVFVNDAEIEKAALQVSK